ncbi:MAG: nucleotidyltransferase domain-containing protein [Parcubacteria group bacterium]|nr:nucleotidyltransferase domain-containing protein [Parcubacteria group bacterium]MBI3075271.1 nucleotidyltransferase domain-containing protein [Parcubacteria group bacterium]
MKIEHEAEEKLKEQIKGIIGKHLNLEKYRVFFFGSRVSGTPREGSDIDVGIEGEKPMPRGALSAIQEEIEELSTLYKIDVVDFSHVPEKFKKVAHEREYLN